MLCFDIPADLQEKIGEVLLAGNATQYGQGPFSLYAILMLRIVESFDRAVWSWRDVVRDLEKTRASDDALEKRSFEHMHETARHVIHCSEMLETAISVAESAAKEVRGSPSYQGDAACSTIVKDLELSVSLLTSLRNRSQALEKRLDNEINLASQVPVTSIFQADVVLTRNIYPQALHLNARHDSLVNNRIAELAHRDGQVMKGIGILGMVFLPGTFVSVSLRHCNPTMSLPSNIDL
jgi:Mg2+ and Co2+ transporter CorA